MSFRRNLPTRESWFEEYCEAPCPEFWDACDKWREEYKDNLDVADRIHNPVTSIEKYRGRGYRRNLVEAHTTPGYGSMFKVLYNITGTIYIPENVGGLYIYLSHEEGGFIGESYISTNLQDHHTINDLLDASKVIPRGGLDIRTLLLYSKDTEISSYDDFPSEKTIHGVLYKSVKIGHPFLPLGDNNLTAFLTFNEPCKIFIETYIVTHPRTQRVKKPFVGIIYGTHPYIFRISRNQMRGIKALGGCGYSNEYFMVCYDKKRDVLCLGQELEPEAFPKNKFTKVRHNIYWLKYT